jgi:hypothetical protein
MRNTAGNPAAGRMIFSTMLLSILPAITVFLFLSCVSEAGGGSWNSYSEMPAYWDYRTGEIKVTVDHVQEEGIASQIRVMADILLAGGAENKIEAGVQIDTCWIDIRVEQRSFLHDVELLNTIYIDCLIRDEGGRVVGKEYEYRVSKGSILSSEEQQRLFKKILGRVLTSRRDRYREIKRAQRKESRRNHE